MSATFAFAIGLSGIIVRDSILLMRLAGRRLESCSSVAFQLGAILLGATTCLTVLHLMPTLGSILLLAALVMTAALSAAYDLRYMLLPDELTLYLGLSGAAYQLSVGGLQVLDCLLGAAFGAVLLGAIHLIYPLVRGMQGLGLGDVKLGAAIGLGVGMEGIPYVLVVGSLATMLAAAFLMRRTKSLRRRDVRIPFAPGLLAATIGYLILAPL